MWENWYIKGPKCLAWTPFQPLFCKPDDKTGLTSRLGEPSLHKFVMCPPAVESEVKLLEDVEQSQPWPLNAQHMVLVKAYYDFDIVHHSTQFGLDLWLGNTIINIIGVQFLKKGGDLHINSRKKCFFYYRVKEVQDMIAARCKGQKYLFNKLQQNK